MKTIVEIAELFTGLKEKPGNSGFYPHKPIEDNFNMPTEELFKTIGWKEGWAWCVFLTEAVWKLYYTQFDTSLINELDTIFSPSVRITEQNFKRSGFKLSKTPGEGSIVVWRTYRDNTLKWSGHVGIYIKDNGDNHFSTIEGNTSILGEREGTVCMEKTRVYNWDRDGLRLHGFVLPKNV